MGSINAETVVKIIKLNSHSITVKEVTGDLKDIK